MITELKMPDGYRLEKDQFGRFRWTQKPIGWVPRESNCVILYPADGPVFWNKNEAILNAMKHSNIYCELSAWEPVQ